MNALLTGLPSGCVFVARSQSSTGTDDRSAMPSLFRRREPVYVAFDVLFALGDDLRPMPLVICNNDYFIFRPSESAPK